MSCTSQFLPTLLGRGNSPWSKLAANLVRNKKFRAANEKAQHALKDGWWCEIFFVPNAFSNMFSIALTLSHMLCSLSSSLKLM